MSICVCMRVCSGTVSASGKQLPFTAIDFQCKLHVASCSTQCATKTIPTAYKSCKHDECKQWQSSASSSTSSTSTWITDLSLLLRLAFVALETLFVGATLRLHLLPSLELNTNKKWFAIKDCRGCCAFRWHQSFSAPRRKRKLVHMVCAARSSSSN